MSRGRYLLKTCLTRRLPQLGARQCSSSPTLSLAASSSSTQSNLPVTDFFLRALDRFPSGQPSLTFAYGSGVFQQEGQKKAKDNMTDFILAVEDPFDWHAKNLELNPDDYSNLLRRFGPHTVADIQTKFGAKMFFNTLIPWESGLIKYGVISKSDLLTDLLDWDTLYTAGRLHKPVRMLTPDASMTEDIRSALRLNMQSAVHTALLLLPESFSEEELYLTLAGLSYTGDFRMTIGEDRNKVANIVRPNLPHFRRLYGNRLLSINNYVEVQHQHSGGRGRVEQDSSSAARHFHLTQLPRNLITHITKEWNRGTGRYTDVEDVLRSAAYDRDSDDIISKSLKTIVGSTSVSQALKGIVTAGGVKAAKYSAAKLKKMYKSLDKKSSGPKGS